MSPDPRQRTSYDALDRVLGRMDFGVARLPEDHLHVAIARSGHPSGRLTHVDVAAASSQPSVVRVITASTFREELGYVPKLGVQPLLADEVVRYAGEPVALVVGTDLPDVRAAAGLVRVEVEPAPCVDDLDAALADDAPLVHENYPGNIASHWTLRHGDVDAAWADCDRIYEDTYYSPSASHVPMEPHVVLVDATREAVSIETGTQTPFGVRAAIVKVFGLAEDRVVVHPMKTGGAFGAKLEVKVECLAMAAALLVSQPIRLELTRTDVFHTVAKHATRVRLKTGVRHDRVIARKFEIVYDGGAYPGLTASRSGMLRAGGPYLTPNIWIDAYTSTSNTVPAGAIRGSMTSQITFAYESQMNDIALDLGIAPSEFRRRNLLRSGDTYLTGDVIDNLHFDELLDDLESNMAAWPQRSAPALGEPHRNVVRGRGLAIMIKTTGTPSKSEGQVSFDDTGRVSIRCGTSDLGQGSHEALRRIVADALGVGLDTVSMEAFSTDLALFDHMTASSRATFSMGSALSRACARLRDDLDGLTDPDPAAPVGSAARWTAALRTAGRSHMSAVGVYESFGGAGKLDPITAQGPNPSVHWHQGGAAVEVEVNLDTGKVAVVNCHGASFAGRVIHEQAAHAQNEGCMVLGIGTALYEQLVYDGGQLVNGSLDDYLMPTMPDLPPVIGSTLIESDDPDTEPHGIGEMVVPAVAPAIGNAIADALGVRLKSVPFTPEQVLRAWKESRS